MSSNKRTACIVCGSQMHDTLNHKYPQVKFCQFCLNAGIDRSTHGHTTDNHKCSECNGKGHLATDPKCPKFNSSNIRDKHLLHSSSNSSHSSPSSTSSGHNIKFCPVCGVKVLNTAHLFCHTCGCKF